MGSLKRSAEGERNRGNTVRKGESCILWLVGEMPACPEREGIVLKITNTQLKIDVNDNNLRNEK